MSSGVGDAVDLPDGSSIIVISGPGGVGKGTLVERLLDVDQRLWLSRSWTTRARRPGEREDAYHFVTRDRFNQRIKSGGILEWAEFLDYMQGSPVPEPPPGRDVLFEIDVLGASNIKAIYPQALLLFIDAPDRSVQEERLRGRGDDEGRIRQRLAKADEEVALAHQLGATHIVNDELDRALDELVRIIEQHRSR